MPTSNHDPFSRDLYTRDVGSKENSDPPIGQMNSTNQIQSTDTWVTPTHVATQEPMIRRDSFHSANHESPLSGLPAEFKKRVESVFQSDFEGIRFKIPHFICLKSLLDFHP